MGMGMIRWEWSGKGMGTRKSFPHTSRRGEMIGRRVWYCWLQHLYDAMLSLLTAGVCVIALVSVKTTSASLSLCGHQTGPIPVNLPAICGGNPDEPKPCARSPSSRNLVRIYCFVYTPLFPISHRLPDTAQFKKLIKLSLSKRWCLLPLFNEFIFRNL